MSRLIWNCPSEMLNSIALKHHYDVTKSMMSLCEKWTTTVIENHQSPKTLLTLNMNKSPMGLARTAFVLCVAVRLQTNNNSKSSRDIPSQEAYCVSKTKYPNIKILLSSVLCSFKFSIIMV